MSEVEIPEARELFELAGLDLAALFLAGERVWQALARMEQYLDSHLRPELLGEVRPGATVTGPVYLGVGSVVDTGALVHGPAIFGRGCQIRQGALVRGNVVAGDEVVIGHCSEVKGSILLPGAHAPHFNYVGDSILGRHVNLGAGAICSNLKLSAGNVVVRIGDRKYDTGLRKLGAIVGDGCQTGCNAVLSPGTVLGKDTLVYPGALLHGVFPARSIIKLRQQLQVERREL